MGEPLMHVSDSNDHHHIICKPPFGGSVVTSQFTRNMQPTIGPAYYCVKTLTLFVFQNNY